MDTIKAKERYYHPGKCTATAWKQRNGDYAEPQTFDDPSHTWSLAKEKNWGPWSCCGKAANSPGCEKRPARQTLTTHDDTLLVGTTRNNKVKGSGIGESICILEGHPQPHPVVDETEKNWILESGRKVKKISYTKFWFWWKQHKRREAIMEHFRIDGKDFTSVNNDPIKRGVGEFIYFLDYGDVDMVKKDGKSRWLLQKGSHAKKRTHGYVWLWLDEYTSYAKSKI